MSLCRYFQAMAMSLVSSIPTKDGVDANDVMAEALEWAQ